jgi:response regulator RpfG family c-di-GMP phosphodiesterase
MTPDPTSVSPLGSSWRAASGRTRILVMDDQPEVHRSLDHALGERYSYEFASSVEQAREKLSAIPFHLALCEIQRPGEFRFALVEEIIHEHPETAIVLITRLDDPEVADRAFGLGVSGYLVKPFLARQLLITMMNVLRQRDIAAEMQAEARQEGLAVARERAIEELHGSRQETVECLARAIEMHDAETGQHVKRMGSIAAFLGDLLGLDRDRVLLLRAAAPMHDVGKIATPEDILQKPGPLTPGERKQMERHTTVGHQILGDSDSDLLRMAAKIALTHHERWDGNGYPLGLSGEGIPLEGRIVAVVDVFDALLSDRCYWPAMSVEAVAATIREGRETQFDPRIVDALLDHLDEALRLRSVHP